MGLKVKVPPKPEELIRYEMVNEMKIPLVAGGVMDQPHIWLLQYAIVKDVMAIFEAIKIANARRQSESNNGTQTR